MAIPLAPLFASLDLALTDAQKSLDQYPDSLADLLMMPALQIDLSYHATFCHGSFGDDDGRFHLTFQTAPEENNPLYRWEHSPSVQSIVQQICTEVDIQYAQGNA